MRRIAKPKADVLTVFSKCISGLESEEEQERLAPVPPLLALASASYDTHAQLKQLHLLTRETTVGGILSTAEMKKLYKDEVSDRKGSARFIYDEIVNAAPNGTCPLCGVGTVSTLDHHLPQSKYPEYIVIPANLVPACHDCNKAKHASFPKVANQQTIHPYFDDFTHDTWLVADVVETSPPALHFRADAPAGWETLDRERVEHHFRKLKLARLYATNAANELGNIRSHLVNFLKGNEDAIRLYLMEQATSCKSAFKNSWQTATYEALSSSSWFITKGFLQIPASQ